MLSVEEALARCLQVELPTAQEWTPLAQALGRVLAAPARAPLPLPAWDQSAMDGWAVRSEDLPPGSPVALRIVGEAAAGRPATASVHMGESVRIFTGAPLPDGADAVVIQENAHAADGRVQVPGGARPGQHVRRAGSELPAGSQVLDAGRALSAFDLGLLAAIGVDPVPVARRPRVRVLASGDELTPPGRPLGPGMIWASNSALLMGLIAEAGAEAEDGGTLPDEAGATARGLRGAAASGADLIITTGGVSVGDHDHLAAALGGARFAFHKVAMKPGKPLALGAVDGVPVFGLPGNPGSAALTFLLFVRPLLRRALGDPRPFLQVVDLPLTADLRSSAGRAELIPVVITEVDGRPAARPTPLPSSGAVTTLSGADGLALIGKDATHALTGDRVGVALLRGRGAEGPSLRWGGRPPA